MIIYCPHCGAETDEKDRFCIVCGELVHGTAICGACGVVVPIAAAYCPKCGVSFLDHPELCIQRSYAEEEASGMTSYKKEEACPVLEDEQDDESDSGRRTVRLFGRKSHRIEPDDYGENDADLAAGEDEEPRRIFPNLFSRRNRNRTEELPEESQGDLPEGNGEKSPETAIESGMSEDAAEDGMEDLGEEDGLSPDAEAEAGKEGGATVERRKGRKKKERRARSSPPKRTKKAKKSSKKALLLGLLRKQKKGKVTVVSVDDDGETPNPDLPNEGREAAEELSKQHRRKRPKVDEREKAAMEAFENIANRDGYYNDVHPADFGEDEDERPSVDMKQIIVMVVLISIACAIIVKLQSLL